MTHRHLDNFADIEPEFRKRVKRMVWCNVATIDTRNRPSSRILHPIWEDRTGWIGTHRDSTMVMHLSRNPHVSLAYVTNVVQPVLSTRSPRGTRTWLPGSMYGIYF